MIADADKWWHGVKFGESDWGEHSHSIAFTTSTRKELTIVHPMLNAFREPLELELPLAPGAWRRRIDISLQLPEDIVEWRRAPAFPGNTQRAGPRSVVVLQAPVG